MFHRPADAILMLVSPLEHLVRVYPVLSRNPCNRRTWNKCRLDNAPLLLSATVNPFRRATCSNLNRLAHKAIVGLTRVFCLHGEKRTLTPFPSNDDWAFASKRAKGKRPIWGQSIMGKQIHPVIERLGITKRIGWHSFRHSYSTLLRHLGSDIKVQQDLLRHSSARLTLDTYTQAVTPAKREAQNAVIKLLLPAESTPLVAPTTSSSYISA
jgi:hypothetical protein